MIPPSKQKALAHLKHAMQAVLRQATTVKVIRLWVKHKSNFNYYKWKNRKRNIKFQREEKYTG